MKIVKSHFWYAKAQRNGILFLVLIIVVFQLVYLFVDFSSDEIEDVSSLNLIAFQKRIDSLKTESIKGKKPKIYPFNPNFITDFKGYKLGMSVAEINRLHNFRKQNKWVNSAKQFKEVTNISDSLYKKLLPYFKFPEWVVKRNNSRKKNLVENNYSYSSNRKPKTIDINKATAHDFETVNGIGEKLSNRIVKYREKLKGFSYENQLYEVWNIPPEVTKKMLQVFRIVEKPIIKKLNVNTARFKEVLRLPYIDYELCKKIFDYRDEVAELQNISELKSIEGFPLHKYDKITLYLKVE